MAKMHICRNRPDFKDGDDPWAEGRVFGCAYHEKRNRTMPEVKGIRDKAAIDKRAGVIGVDSGDGFIRG